MTLPTARGTGGSVLVDRCQICEGPDLEPIVFVGYLPPVNTLSAIGTRLMERPAYPAQVLRCRRCELVQLGLIVDPAILFPPGYAYTSGTTRILRENFAELEREVAHLLALPKGALVVDVGSNDGTLLTNFASAGQRVLGVEPTDVGRLAEARGIRTIQAFFDGALARSIRAEHGPAALVTATNVFAHIEDVHDVVEGILALLADDGTFVSESHYWLALVEDLQYDTIYHEHLRFYSIRSLQNLLEAHGLEIFHAKRIRTHGGSIRVYAARKGVRPPEPTVAELLRSESEGLSDTALADFRARIVRSKLDLHALLGQIRSGDARVYGVGAPSRAVTLVNHVGLDEHILDCIVEIKGSYKIGSYLPGTLIPVLEESRLVADRPDYALLLSWHLADDLIPKLRDGGYRGRYVVPLPEPRIVG